MKKLKKLLQKQKEFQNKLRIHEKELQKLEEQRDAAVKDSALKDSTVQEEPALMLSRGERRYAAARHHGKHRG